MRYGIALAISMLLIFGAIGFVMFVDFKLQQFQNMAQDFQVALPASFLAAISVARFFKCFWYIFLFLFIAIPMAVAAIWPRGNKEEESQI
jgi:hypothetical protein